jgi:FkbH-like protein
MKTISFTSNTFLMPQSESWKILKKNFLLKFNSLNNFENILLDNNSDFNVILLTIQDLIEYPLYDLSTKNKNLKKKKIKCIFDLIKKNLAQKKIVLIIDYFYPTHFNRNIKNNTIEDYLIHYIQNLSYEFKNNKNFYCLDIRNIFFRNNEKYDYRMQYLTTSRYSNSNLKSINIIINQFLERIYKPSKKVIILDCDNTLWGGVVGELGCHNIILGEENEGKAYVDFQKSLKRLKNEGVILCVASKNNYQDVIEVFKKNKNMVLSKEDITLFKVNWKNKSDNIFEISKELNLGIESFTFFDDNPIERDQVQKNLKTIEVINPDGDVSNWATQILDSTNLCKINFSEEDKNKTKHYHNILKFKDEQSRNSNEKNFLMNIGLKAKLINFSSENKIRALQLIQKTNQFNLNTKRYDEKELQYFSEERKNKIYLFSLKDKYGDHGIVGLTMLRQKKEKMFIENFLISCRVLGRYLDSWMMKKIFTYAKKSKCQTVIGKYTKSNKNDLVKDFYTLFGFKKSKPKIILNKKEIFYICDVNKLNLTINIDRLYK